MDWINKIGNNDNYISQILINEDDVVIRIRLWNGIIEELRVLGYWMIKDNRSIGKEIGDIIIADKSNMLKELENEILDSGGSLNEISRLKSVIFKNVWDEGVILEIVAEKFIM